MYATVIVERWRRDARRPRRSSLMILLISRSNVGSARRGRREGSVGPSEGRATVTRSSLAFGLGLQSEID